MLEGHRFAHRVIKKGEALQSWDLPFGYALRKIEPGEYVCNGAILDALRLRHLDFALPLEPNFYDEIRPYVSACPHNNPSMPLEREACQGRDSKDL